QSFAPEDLRTLEAAQALIDRKRFSWSQLLADLESVLPADVRVSRINVRDVAQVGGQMRADLDLSVVGRTPTDVTGMITKMQEGGVFFAQPVSESPLHGRGEGGFERAQVFGRERLPELRGALVHGRLLAAVLLHVLGHAVGLRLGASGRADDEDERDERDAGDADRDGPRERPVAERLAGEVELGEHFFSGLTNGLSAAHPSSHTVARLRAAHTSQSITRRPRRAQPGGRGATQGRCARARLTRAPPRRVA
ncbi:MAG TPA: hypothetical protein VEQ42_03850, partial [Pyrinomonadaceae bacterium]|nr:hypothetical protein [Pyrinomonadaceae bacterium]